MVVRIRKAFTLAEVLITLVIIGVLSALVIPAMVQNIQDAHFKTAYRRAFSVANQAIIRAYNDNQLSAMTSESDHDAMHTNFNAFMNEFVVTRNCPDDAYNCWNASGEFITAPEDRPQPTSSAFIDNSGMGWTMYSSDSGGTALIMIDTNGYTVPNRYGKDRWFLKLVDINGSRSSGIPIKIVPYDSVDIIVSGWTCHYPPCNNISWLKQ